MANEHFEKCKARVLGHADTIISRIRRGEVNASAFEGVMESYLRQPAYQGYRERLLDLALTRLDGRSSNDR